MLYLLAERTKNVEISVATVEDDWTVVACQDGPMGPFYSAKFNPPLEARYVRVTLRDANDYMHLCEVEVLGFE